MDQNFPLGLSYDDVLLVPQYSEIESRKDVDLTTQISPNLTLKIPLITTKMDTITGVAMAIAIGKLGGLGILPRFETIEEQAGKVKKVFAAGVLAAAAVGVKDGFEERAVALVNAGATVIDIDVAHGHMKKTLEATKRIKNLFGNKITIISGITSTYECARDLYKAGADCVLVGIGAGSICTTRVMTGFGVPSITALLETAKAARQFKKTFAPDAGVRNSGDIVKALATGASAIVGGNIFAGTDEAPGDIVIKNGIKYKAYNGSTSKTEKIKQVKKDSSDKNGSYTRQIEGVEAYVEYKGPLNEIVENLLAGVRSGLSYGGAKNIPELWKKAKFIRITPGGKLENGAHDVFPLGQTTGKFI
jgi:IMP dehydrogenase